MTHRISRKVVLRMRRLRGACALASCLLAAALVCGQAAPVPSPNAPAGQEPYVFRLTTREVLIDLLATDRRDHSVRDLTQQEIEIVELNGHGKKTPVPIASFRPVDAALEHAPVAPQSGGFRVTLGGDCAARTTFHYAISFRPDEEGWQSGFHEIEVRTTRRGVKLDYRTRYYVGARAGQRPATAAETASALQAAACYHADVPPSIRLAARPVSTGLKDVVRFFVTVDSDSLAFISVSTDSRRVQLDYGACMFDGRGKPLRYFSSAADRMLTSQEYAQAVVHGFPNLLELPRIADAAMMRVVVRDRATGNIGNLDLALAPDPALPPQAVSTTDEESVENTALRQMEKQASEQSYYGVQTPYDFPPPGPIGSFGSIVPRPNTFCGDVYDLPRSTNSLPRFWNLSSIGSLYTPELDVPHQIFDNTGGIPGITSQTAWIGIDYHGTFWVNTPGIYTFRLLVDDGARLYIDDEKVIDMDGVHSGQMEKGQVNLTAGLHSIHVPYIQGPPNAVGLIVAVMAPGEQDFKIFDLREFPAPQGEEHTEQAGPSR